jgi:hypothetical protein
LKTLESPEELVSSGSVTPSQGPLLLLGTHRRIDKSDLIESLPPRPVVDRLVSRFFNAKEFSMSEFDFGEEAAILINSRISYHPCPDIFERGPPLLEEYI